MATLTRRPVNANLVSELEWWHGRGFIRFHGVDTTYALGVAYMVETSPGATVRWMLEQAACEFVMGLFAGQRPRFAVPADSTIAASPKGAA